MANTETTTFEIVTLEDGEWVTDYVGAENTFNTIDEALEAIRSRRALGGEWAATACGVRETGEPLGIPVLGIPVFGTTIFPAEECPTEWLGRARRVEIEIPLLGRSRFVHGWQLLEDIEGHVQAGQVWIDGDEDSTFPPPDWSIEPD